MRHAIHFLLIGVAICALSPVLRARAQDSQPVESRATQTQIRSSVEAKLEERLARDWGLKADEWARYRELMKGPLGIYSPNIDPLTALGIEARSDEERRRYAELQVQAEGRRVEKLLAYQRAYDEAWQRLYPTLLPVNLISDSGSSRHPMVRGQGRLAVFVRDLCTPCEQKTRELQAAGRSFDLYMVDSQQDDSRIRAWAARAGIDPAKVRARVITLNHDAGQWASIDGQGELPAVVREVNGRWLRE